MKPGCICKEGFVRDGNNNCIPEYPYCSPPCNNPYEEFQMCPCDSECNKPKVKVFELAFFSCRLLELELIRSMFDENRKNGIERFAITVDQNGFAKT